MSYQTECREFSTPDLSTKSVKFAAKINFDDKVVYQDLGESPILRV